MSRTGFAPAGRQIEFHGVITYPPIPIDQQSLVALNFLFVTPELGFDLHASRVKADAFARVDIEGDGP